MAVKQRIQLRAVSNVAASKTALIDLPLGPRYHAVFIEHGHGGTDSLAATVANITDIRVKVNGRVQRSHSGQQLRDLNSLNGGLAIANSVQYNYDVDQSKTASTGVVFPIYFGEPWRKDARDQDALAWATNKYASLQIEVDLGAAATPTLLAYAIADNFQPEKEGMIVKVIRQSFNAGGTSFDITNLDRRDFLQQISFYMDSGGSRPATKVTFRRDGVILHDLSAAANKAVLCTHGMMPTAVGRTASMYDLVFDHDDLLGSSVPMDGTRDCSITIEAASAMSGTITALIQRLGLPE